MTKKPSVKDNHAKTPKKSADKDKSLHKEGKMKKESRVRKTTGEPQTMDELLSMMGEGSISVKKGDTVEGKVVSVSPKEVFFDIGKKSFGILAEWELDQVKDYAMNLKPDDKVTAQVMNPENDSGYIVLSLRRANTSKRWQELSKAKDDGSDLTVTCLEMAKGGLLVDWYGLRGFIPFTQLESSLAQSPGQMLGKKLSVKIIEIDRTINRLVVSQKASAMGVTPSKQREKLEKIKKGDVLKGSVSGLASFGIFIDIDGLEGLVHISEIAWDKVENTTGLYKTGDKLEVYVLDVNKEENKLNLSVKRLTPDPWKNILDIYPPESTVKGEVVRMALYGAFVKLAPGVEGLLHISKINENEKPKVGDMLECIIEKIDPVKRKISLTLVPKAKPVGYR